MARILPHTVLVKAAAVVDDSTKENRRVSFYAYARLFVAVVLVACSAGVAYADSVLYTLSTDLNGTNGAVAGSAIDWQFSTPAILTSSTVIGSFLSTETGGSFANCTIASATVPSNAGVVAPSVTSLTTSFSSPCSTLPGLTGEVVGSIAEFQQDITTLGAYTAYSRDGSTPIGTLTIAAETTLQGGPASNPVTFSVPEIAEVSGTIGSFGSEDYYTFVWAGGDFSAEANVSGTVNPDASYLFSAGLSPYSSCGSVGSITLDTADGFSGSINAPDLAPGQYCIGLSANSASDPNFSITFDTPVQGVPEPGTFVLLGTGFLSIAARFRNRLLRLS